uniref:Guanylate-kinase-associated protein n=1 Tax=Anopheles atroparvus TaxID=41427 RepID=A0AAG5DBZ1_ANOAO
MDRSVDSIGSCSLDVDADSTDFSDTSGELNFLTPISGKDITREFTAGIKERCMLPVINCQAVTSVLDPVTGHIRTVLTTTATSQHPTCPATQPLLGNGDTSPTAPASNKKPSYLNLACCVNGYSNLTTYDSKLRQDINKSREVSPSRPIIATLHYNRTESGAGGGGHLLTAPTLSYVSMNNTINNNYNSSATIGSGTNRMFKMNGSGGAANGGAAGGGRMRAMNAGGGSVSPAMGAADVTDNAALNGFFNGNAGSGFLGSGMMKMHSKVISSQSQITSLSRSDADHQTLATPKKSFIQQRVEKLYGASEGVVINKQYYSSSERKYLNNIANENHGNGGGAPNGSTIAAGGKGAQSMANGNGGVAGTLAKNGVGNGHHHPYPANDWGCSLITVDENNRQINSEDQEGADPEIDALPVMRHLRPEFRAQLQIFSPKKVPKVSPNRTTALSAPASNGNNNQSHTNGTIGQDSMAHLHLHSVPVNGNSHIEREEEHARDEHTSYQEEQQQLASGSTIRSTVSSKSARVSTESSITANANGTTSSNGHLHEEALLEESSNITRHHSNASSTRTVTVSSTDGSYSGSIPTPELVEEMMRSLVVVPPTPTATSPPQSAESCVSTQRTPNVAIAVVPDTDSTDVLKPATVVVAASVIENGEQNRSAVGSNALEIVGGEGVVHCDNSSTVTEQAVANTMRTSNGGETTIVVGVPAKSIPVTTMAGIERHHQQVDAVEVVDSRRAKSTEEVLATATNGTIISSSSDSSSNNNNDVLDGNYFLQILKTERHRLEAMADEVEKEISQLKGDGVDIGEDLNGYILAAVGKARLLCSQKIKQFEDLCYTNLNQLPDEKFQTTCEDLRGFWDMVMLQVNNVDATFVEIDSFRKNGWRKPIPKSPPQSCNGAPRTTKLVKRPYKTQTNGGGSTVTDGGGAVEAKKASAALAAAKREAQRKQLMEMKRKQKLANSQPQQQAVEIFAPSAEQEGGPAQLNGGDSVVTQQRTTAVDTS